MNEQLRQYLERLYAEGAAFDARQTDRLLRRRNLEPDSAHLLWMVLLASGFQSIVEVGTSNGYSTLWWADAAGQAGGHVVSLDVDPQRQAEARRHLELNGLQARVDLVCQDGGVYLANLPEESVDFLFLDAERSQYASWWPHPVRVLRRRGLLVIDNATSHRDEVRPFAELLRDSAKLECQLVDIGKGELICCTAP